MIMDFDINVSVRQGFGVEIDNRVHISIFRARGRGIKTISGHKVISAEIM